MGVPDLAEAELTKAGGLAKLGDEGWELASVVPKIPRVTGSSVNLTSLRIDKTSGMGSGSGMANGFTCLYEPAETRYIFKRPK